MPQGSKIFLPNRALGYVSNHIPLQVRYIKRRKEHLITTCTGKFFHTYGISHFTLLSVSGLHPEDITCMSTDTFHVYTAAENIIYAWRRGAELKHTYRGHKKPVHLLMPFGIHLLSVDESSCLKVWDIKTEELYLEFTFNNESFKITTILHPSTYINKILLGSEQGTMQIWNVKTSKLIYTFQGWDSSITCLEQAPAIDVVAVGLANGKIILHNLKYDEIVMEFMQDLGFVTTISFRTDGFSIMATGSVTGDIVFWNLEERKVETQLMAAHDGSVTGMICLPEEPLMLTSSSDNTLKLWIFDMTDGGPRLLRIREGHSATPTCIRFHGLNGDNLLSSAGDSTLRIFNTLTETFNKSLGKASYNRKISKKRSRVNEDPLIMPPITYFTSEITREKEWDNIAAIHLGIPMVTTWSYDKRKMGDLKIVPKRFQKKNRDLDSISTATCLCLTHCGNFVIIGYSTGHVDRYNIQSGIHRDNYGESKAHDTPIRGVASDVLNQLVVTAAGNTIKFWPFKCKGSSTKTVINLEELISFTRTHRESSLIAVALEDFSIQILDLDTRRIIRKFIGHTGQITDATFSTDSRWLISASMDCTIKTWNIPSGQLIDHFRMDSACVSLTMSPTAELLATAHVDFHGVFLWSNFTLYSNVNLKGLPEDSEAPLVELPDVNREHIGDAFEETEDNDEEFKTPEQISHNLVTLSNVANSRWQNLLNIDIIKKRNKPKAPLKAPKAAPFFLPTIPSLNFQFDLNKNNDNNDSSRVINVNNFINFSPFGKVLQTSIKSEDFTEAIDKLKSMGPSMIDFEIKCLSPDEGGTVELMLQFLKCIEFMLSSNNNFELAQAYLAVFLKSHGNLVASEKSLLDYILNIQSSQRAGWERLQEKLFYNLCVIQALKSM